MGVKQWTKGKQRLWENMLIQLQTCRGVLQVVSHYVLKLYRIQDCEEGGKRPRNTPKHITMHMHVLIQNDCEYKDTAIKIFDLDCKPGRYCVGA